MNGIDILCDAAGSDLLLNPTFSPPKLPAQLAEPPLPAAARKRKLSVSASEASPSSSSTHVCHICKRVYERADHLTRHLRSHENARPYACSRCPKRFNRADLLTRHETTHDRDSTGKGRTFIRRSDRAAEACLNCAASKSKCEVFYPAPKPQCKRLADLRLSRTSSLALAVALRTCHAKFPPSVRILIGIRLTTSPHHPSHRCIKEGI